MNPPWQKATQITETNSSKADSSTLSHDRKASALNHKALTQEESESDYTGAGASLIFQNSGESAVGSGSSIMFQTSGGSSIGSGASLQFQNSGELAIGNGAAFIFQNSGGSSIGRGVGLLFQNSSGESANRGVSVGFTGAASFPSITSMSPLTPVRSANDQSVTVNGSNFQQGLTVSVTFPNGSGTILSGTQIQEVTPTSFRMRITLNATGNWSIRVNNPGGIQSNTFNYSVQSMIQTPSVFLLDPTTPFASPTDQDVLVIGSNFQPNLTVVVTFPTGGGTTLSGSQILNITPSAFVMRITLNATGSWSIRVNNPDGGQSGLFSFMVQVAGQLPIISSINPVSPMSKNSDQNVIVTGNNFTPGLVVNVNFPNGGQARLQGTGQIQNVTTTSFLMRITVNGEGSWSIRVINSNGAQSNSFNFMVQAANPTPTGIPTSVLSPVIGALRVTSSNLHIADGKWEFNQHKTSFHRPAGGISGSNDTNAWDVNLYTPSSGNQDAGQPVYAVASGDVVLYAGLMPGAKVGAVLIAHPNKDNPVWWSGYLHLKNIKVTLNQSVTENTVIGDIGSIGADNDHLHFVAYHGQNIRGGLRSFNPSINERGTAASQPPFISSINPQNITEGENEQDIVVEGDNFTSNLSVTLDFPNGGGRTIIPVTATSSLEQQVGPRILSVSTTFFIVRSVFQAPGIWTMRVNNSDGGQSSPVSFSVQQAQTSAGRTPLIFISGVAGSYLDKVEGNNRTNLWLGRLRTDHREMTLNVDSSHYQGSRIHATNVLLKDTFDYRLISKTVETYQSLLEMLTDPTRGGYKYYNVNNDPNRRTTSGCDLSQAADKPTLFIFAYDWRKSNIVNAEKLQDYIGCVRRFYPNTSVNILAHSMGGLLARRYIIKNPNNHHVNKLITIGSPWLGAPKAIHVLETGQWPPATSYGLILPGTLKTLAEDFTGFHELLPSRKYADLGGVPFAEDGWDINQDNSSGYNYNQLTDLLNNRHHRTQPGTATLAFHDNAGQDDWSSDQSGVQYYHYYGLKKSADTIGRVIAKRSIVCSTSGCFVSLDIITSLTIGDGTVPTISARRIPSLNAPNATIRLFSGFNADDQEPFEHVGLTRNDNVWTNILSDLSIAQQSTPRKNPTEPIEPPAQPAYHFRILGSTYVEIEDAFGNTVNPLSDTPEEPLSGADTISSGDKGLSIIFQADKAFSVRFRVENEPLFIEIARRTDTTTSLAVRYQDIELPAGVTAQISLTGQSVEVLKYDSDGDGVFETSVQPTVSVTGTAAEDTDPPIITLDVTGTPSAVAATITAQDSGSGVARISYSTDGTNYGPYKDVLNIDVNQNPLLYVFADDNLANRTGVSIYRLAPTVSPNSQYFAQRGGEGQLNVEALSGISWMAASNSNWITLTSAETGNGNGVISYAIRDNLTGSARQGTLTVAGRTVTIVQDGGSAENCTYTVTPLFESFAATGGSGIITLTTSGDCAWQATTSDDWITVTSTNMGIGSISITYSVSSNSSGSGRNGVITVAGKTIAIKQKAE